jgi:hypothetical protein
LNKPIKIFFLFFLLAGFFHSEASDTLLIGKGIKKGNDFIALRTKHLEVFYDETDSLKFEDIQKAAFRKPLSNETNDKEELIFDKSSPHPLWIKFTVKNVSSPDADELDKRWLIEVLDFNTKELTFFIPDSAGRYDEWSAGFRYPFSYRHIRHKNHDFDIPYSAKPQTVYVRVIPGNATLFVVHLKSEREFIEYSNSEYYLLGLFYGLILIMGIYNLILFINIREPYYLFYLLFVTFLGLSSMCHDGTGFQFLWPNHPEWNDDILILSMFGIVLWTLFYSRWFLSTKRNYPFIDKIFLFFIVLTFALFLIVEFFRPPYLIYLLPASLIPFGLIYFTGWKVYLNGYTSSRFFLFAFTFFLLGLSIRLLKFFNLIEGSIFTVYSFNIGAALEMILFSIAIGDRIRMLKDEKEKAMIEKEKAQGEMIRQLKENEKLKDKVNRELEEKVRQRTVELEVKNDELKIANEKLKYLTDQANQWNIKLDLYNRKLQTNIRQLTEARVLLKDVKFEEFSAVFPDENSCLKYLSELKWKDGFECRKCGNTSWGTGKAPFSRRCTRCNYVESPTNDTLFHRLRFPITKAFYMVYLVSVRDKNITADELSEILDLRRETCWAFKKKILQAKKGLKKHEKNGDMAGIGSIALVRQDL